MIQSITNPLRVGLLVGACLCAASSLVQAQNHYPAGAEGIKGASLPPPGVYLRDYNLFYQADRLNGAGGHKAPVDFSVLAYVNAPRLIWMSDYKIAGATYGMDVLVPLVYTDLSVKVPNGPTLVKDRSFALGDIQIEPLLLAWHWSKFDLSAGYAFWAPTGDTGGSYPGKGFWSNMLTLGGTWFPTEDKSWALSLLNRYEIHTENDAGVTFGNTYTIEWGLSKGVTKTVDVGLIGYYQQQTTDDSGPGVNTLHDRVFGIGPELSVAFPEHMFFVSLRYAREIGAVDHSEGNTVTLTLTKRF